MKQLLKKHLQAPPLVFTALLILLLFTRFLGNNYDQGHHLHPDERMLMMVISELKIPDRLDPNFFAYGSFPLYTLKAMAQASDTLFKTQFDNYDGLLRMGRALASLLDVGLAALIFLLARQLTQRKAVAYFALISYLLMFFPTQNSNFFIVDNFVNFFFSLTLLFLVIYWRRPRWRTLVALSISYGLLLTSKITPLLLAPLLVTFLAFRPWLERLITPPQAHTYLARLRAYISGTKTTSKKSPRALLATSVLGPTLFLFLVLLTSFLTMPYAWIKSTQFISEVSAQIRMNSDAYVFPYTLQYVKTTPYLYPLRQVFFWGVGPPLATLALIGFSLVFRRTLFLLRRKSGWKTILAHPALPYALVQLMFFLVIGQSAVKFMRYLLPLYGALALLAGISLDAIWGVQRKSTRFSLILITILLLLAASWYGSFLSIYTRRHPRLEASDWIKAQIAPGAKLAVEHWDDRLPLTESERFHYLELELYNQPDSEAKWQIIKRQLANADYLILASNRLFGVLPRLASCEEGVPRCYPRTAQYYQALFADQLNFRLVAEFTNRPIFFHQEIIDDDADESFTVYDHPRVLIFKKEAKNNL